MEIYAVIVTIIALALAITTIKWKIATKSLSLFCIEKFRKPTDKEIADCTKRTVSHMFMNKG